MPSVSVIIPCYNREALVGETISNLLAQSTPPDEIIAVDDGSTDATVKVLRSFGPKVTVLEQVNNGPGAARNAGLKIARGDLIQFQDSDDFFSLNKIEAQARLLEATGSDIAVSPWVKVWIKGRRIKLENHVLQQAMPPARLPLASWWLRGWSTVFQTLMFRRSFLDRVGLYRTDLRLGEDGDLFFRALLLNPKLVFTDEPLSLYRLHGGAKLTEGDGEQVHRRTRDWALCLQGALERVDQHAVKIDWVTRRLLLRELAKQLHYLEQYPDSSVALKAFLRSRLAKEPELLQRGVDTWERINDRIREVCQGSRWRAGYQVGPLTLHQRELIKNLGITIEEGRYS